MIAAKRRTIEKGIAAENHVLVTEITINMLAKKFGLFGLKESEVFSYFASEVRTSKMTWKFLFCRQKE